MRCLFCGAQVAVPTEIIAQLDQDDVLDRASERIETQMENLERQTGWGNWLYIAVALGMALFVLLAGIALTVAQWVSGSIDEPQAIRGLIGGLVTLGIFVVVGSIITFSVLWQQRRTPPLPMAVPVWHADTEALIAQCYRCSAKLDPQPNQITATCSSCDSACLLPAPMVDQSMRKKHNKYNK